MALALFDPAQSMALPATKVLSPLSQPSHEQQYEQNQHNETKPAARVVTPALAVGPGGQRAHKEEYQDNKKYRSHSHALLFFAVVAAKLLGLGLFDRHPITHLFHAADIPGV